MRASSVQVKQSRSQWGIPSLCAMLIVAESPKWRMLNRQPVVSYTGDSCYCPEDCGGGSKVANAEHTACGKLQG